MAEKTEDKEIPKTGENGDFKIDLHTQISDTLAGEMSDVSDHAIDEAEIETENELKKTIESTGEFSAYPGFDPNIHALKDGKPIPRIKNGEPVPGKWQKKRGVKKGGNTAKSSVVSGGDTVKPSDVVNDGSMIAGRTAAHVLITLGCTIGGDEWQPVKNEEYGLDEQANLEKAFSDYFKATGKTDFPPGVALAIAVGGYVLPRFTRPKTQSRLKKAGEWIYLKFRKLRGKLPKKAEKSEEKEK